MWTAYSSFLVGRQEQHRTRQQKCLTLALATLRATTKQHAPINPRPGHFFVIYTYIHWRGHRKISTETYEHETSLCFVGYITTPGTFISLSSLDWTRRRRRGPPAAPLEKPKEVRYNLEHPRPPLAQTLSTPHLRQESGSCGVHVVRFVVSNNVRK